MISLFFNSGKKKVTLLGLKISLFQGGLILNNSNSTLQTRISEEDVMITNDDAMITNVDVMVTDDDVMITNSSLVPAWPKDTFETKFDDREDSPTKEMQALIPGSYTKRS